MRFPIVPMMANFWPAVRDIYREGIATGNATFETDVPQWDEWNNDHRRDCRLVALEPFEKAAPDSPISSIPSHQLLVLGWAALRPVSSRYVYRGVAEVSVYVAARVRGRGVGRALLEALVAESEANSIWTLQAGILPENAASLVLHRSCGFREVGIRQRIGKLGDTWRDVLLLERRSGSVGL